MLEARDLGKSYAAQLSSRARLLRLFTGRGETRRHEALAQVSFKLERGHCLGIVGDNGAGKSTLLKLVAGTLRPTTGQVVREGRLTAILELGAGLHPSFTGRENIYFLGALIGIPEDEMRRLEPEVIAFSELAADIDRPIKTYSSGMVVRLAFSLVTVVEPDILIIDEALAVGDQHFQRKCIDRIEAFRRNGCTILFCSHSLYQVRRLCDQAIWLDQGRVRAQGTTEAVLVAYETYVRNQIAGVDPDADASGSQRPDSLPAGGSVAHIMDVELAGLETVAGTPLPRLTTENIRITVRAYVPGEERPNIAVLLERADQVCITGVGTHGDGGLPPRSVEPGVWESTLEFLEPNLYSGDFRISVFLFDPTGTLVYEEWRDCRRFSVVRPTLEVGVLRLPHRWS